MQSGNLRLEPKSVVLKFDYPKKDLIVVYALVAWQPATSTRIQPKQLNQSCGHLNTAF